MAKDAISELSASPVTATKTTVNLSVLYVPVLPDPPCWYPAPSAPPWWSSAPPWWFSAPSALPWWSSALLWWSSSPLWWSSAPPWLPAPSAPPWLTTPPWHSALPALLWLSARLVPPLLSAPLAPPWLSAPPALPQSPVASLPHGPGPLSLPLFCLCSTSLLDFSLFCLEHLEVAPWWGALSRSLAGVPVSTSLHSRLLPLYPGLHFP